MREFKFFQKGTIDMMDGDVQSTASFNADTPEGYVGRRRLYHTNIPQYERQREMFRRLREDDVRDLNDNPIRLFQTTTVTKVNPKWWMKIKIFFQEMKIKMYIQDNSDMFGIIFLATSGTICLGLILGKILSIW